MRSLFVSVLDCVGHAVVLVCQLRTSGSPLKSKAVVEEELRYAPPQAQAWGRSQRTDMQRKTGGQRARQVDAGQDRRKGKTGGRRARRSRQTSTRKQGRPLTVFSCFFFVFCCVFLFCCLWFFFVFLRKYCQKLNKTEKQNKQPR